MCVCVPGTYAQYARTRSYTQKKGEGGELVFQPTHNKVLQEHVNCHERIAKSCDISFKYVFLLIRLNIVFAKWGRGTEMFAVCSVF